MEQSTRFWDKIADRYAKMPIADEAAYQQKLDITRTYLRPEMEVLEIGCGTGSTALLHAPYVQRIRAIDFSANMIQIARNKAADQGITNVEFEQVAIADLQIPDQSLDVVLGMSILHLLEDKEAVIAQVYRLLKPGGVFVTSTTCLGDFAWYLKFAMPVLGWLGMVPLLKVLTMQDLVNSFTQAGFVIDHQWHPGKGKAVFIVAQKP
jgi:ubiquinone/menaquinone biosynthesis C-methylase UbiE